MGRGWWRSWRTIVGSPSWRCGLNAGADRRLRGAVLLGLVVALVPLVGRAALGPRYGGEIVVGLPDLPDSAAPRTPLSLGDRLLSRLVHETLVRIGPEG